MKKIVLILIIIAVIIAIAVIVKMNMKPKYDKPADFGKATMALIDSGKIVLACDDAKLLVSMIGTINKEFTDNPDLAATLSDDNVTPAMKEFEAAITNFGKEIEDKYKDNVTQKDTIFATVGEGFSSVYQASLMSSLGILTPEQVNEYVDVTYCGVKPKEGYVSPLAGDPTAMIPPAGQDNSTVIIEETPTK